MPVGVHGMGWKGVGVGDAFGAAVTNTNGKAGCAGAKLPHPASSIPARSMTRKVLFMRYGDSGVIGVRDGVAVLLNVAVGICVSVGAVVLVGGTGVLVLVVVGKFGTTVTPGTGVCVGTFGTQSNWPA